MHIRQPSSRHLVSLPFFINSRAIKVQAHTVARHTHTLVKTRRGRSRRHVDWSKPLFLSARLSHAWLAASSQSMVDRWFSRGSSGAVEGASLSAAGVGGVGGGGQARCAKVSRSAGCTRQKASYAWSYVGARAAHGAYTRSGGGGATTDPEGLRRRIAAPIAAAPSAGACSGCAGTCTVRCSTSARICTGGAERVQLRCGAGIAQVQSGCGAGAERVLCECCRAGAVVQRRSGAAVQRAQTCGSSSERATPPTSVSGGGGGGVGGT